MTQTITTSELKAALGRHRSRAFLNDRTSVVLMAVVATLLVIGLTALLSASSTVAIRSTLEDGDIDRFLFFRQQLRGVGLGLVLMWLTSRLPYKIYKGLAVPLFASAVALLVLVLLTGPTIGGARSWLRFGGWSFQPSEFAKFALIIALATALERKRRALGDFKQYAGLVLAYLGLIGLLVAKQPDIGTLIVISGAAMAVLLTSSAPVSFVGLTGSAALVAGGILARTNQVRFARIVSFRNPWADPLGDGYQAIQSMYALSNGGLTGVGLGAGRARWFYLPGAHTDFIFAVFGEEAGMIGAGMVLLLFLAFSLIGWSIAMRARDPFGRMVAAGITAWITVQAVVNIGGVVGAMPITGVPLPFMSYGSTAVMMAMAAVGVLINISRASPALKTVAGPVAPTRPKDAPTPPEPRQSVSRVRRSSRPDRGVPTPHPNRGKAAADRRRSSRASRR